MGRDTNLWGPSARDYRPSRWIDESGHVKRFSTWQAHFFNGGYRYARYLMLEAILTIRQALSRSRARKV